LKEQVKVIDDAINSAEKRKIEQLRGLIEKLGDEHMKRGNAVVPEMQREEEKVLEERPPIMLPFIATVGDEYMRIMDLNNLQPTQSTHLSEPTGGSEHTAYTLITDRHMFCCGGSINRMKTSFVVERESGAVDKYPDMSHDRGFPGLTYLEEYGSAYVFGGFGKSSNGLVRSSQQPSNSLIAAEMMTFATRTWTALPDMPHKRYAFNICLVNGEIYLVGGWNSEGLVDVFSPTMLTYSTLPMKTSIVTSSAVVQNGEILTFGDGKMEVWALGSSAPVSTQPHQQLTDCYSNFTPITIQKGTDFLIYLVSASTSRLMRITRHQDGTAAVEESRFFRPASNKK
jgi:hypothetical protein